MINLPLIFRAQQRQLTWRFTWATTLVVGLGILGLLIQMYLLTHLLSEL